MQPFETVYVDTVVVACDGTHTGGHPRVYLNLAAAGQIECPYCSRTFILKVEREGANVTPTPSSAHP
ncbi:MAG TPA: zinc-finger domain-containing protein [Stellaceae bacterium]